MGGWVCEKHGNVVDPDRDFVPDSSDCYECWPEVPGKRAWQAGGQAQAARKPLPTCRHLGAEPVPVAGSSRPWRRCGGGHGSRREEVAGLVCLCRVPLAGAWRAGEECGPGCPGFTLSPAGPN